MLLRKKKIYFFQRISARQNDKKKDENLMLTDLIIWILWLRPNPPG